MINMVDTRKVAFDQDYDWFVNGIEGSTGREWMPCLTRFPPLNLGGSTLVPIDPMRDLDFYGFLKYLHEASPGELESGTITEGTLSKIYQ